jgi:chromosome segregation ATPase
VAEGNSKRFSITDSIKKIWTKKIDYQNDENNSPSPVPVQPILPGSTSKMSVDYGMASIGVYDGEMHLPKYSQSEIDLIVMEHTLKVSSLESKLAKMSEISGEKDSKVDSELVEVLTKQLVEEKAKVIAMQQQLDEFCLLRTQNKALSHRLQELEDECAQKDIEHEENIKFILSEKNNKLNELKAQHEAALLQAEADVRKKALAKAQAQYEAGQAKYNALVDDFMALRSRYDARVVEMSVAEEKCGKLESESSSVKLMNESKDSEISQLKDQVEELKRDKSMLINASMSSQSNISTAQIEVSQMREELLGEKRKLVDMQVFDMEKDAEIKRLRLEMEGQMQVIAKLTSAKTHAEKDLSLAQESVVSLTARCEKLRSMNKEMLGMLEGQKE